MSVSPNDRPAKFHASLTDGETTAYFIFKQFDRQGNIVDAPWGFASTPVHRTALKTFQGSGSYDDLDWPHLAKSQEDFSGGRALLRYEKDASRYLDASGVDTTHEGKALLGPLVTYTDDLSPGGTFFPGPVKWVGLYGENRYTAVSFTPSKSFTARAIVVIVRRVGNPSGSIEVKLTDSNRNLLRNAFVSGLPVDVLSEHIYCEIIGALNLTLGTDYRVQVGATAAGDDENHWEIACYPSLLRGERSSDGISWSSAGQDYSIYFRVIDTTGTGRVKFLNYKNGFYALVLNWQGKAKLYLNGNRFGSMSSNWVYLRDLGGPATDAVVAGGFIYVAHGSNEPITRYEYDYDTDIEQSVAEPTIYAEKLLWLNGYLWGIAENVDTYYYKRVLWRANVPPVWSNLYLDKGEIVSTNERWNDLVLPNVFITLENGCLEILNESTESPAGVAAIRNLAEPVDLRSGVGVGFLAKKSVTSPIDPYKLILSDLPNLGMKPRAIFQYIDSDKVYRMLDPTEDNPATVQLGTADYLYICQGRRFNTIRFDLKTFNTKSGTLTLQLYNGRDWFDVAITDTTVQSGVPLARDGYFALSSPTSQQQTTVNEVTGFWARIKVSAATDPVVINKITLNLVLGETIELVGFQLLDSLNWINLAWEYSAGRMPPGENEIQSVGWYSPGATLGSSKVTLIGGIRLISDAPEIFPLPDDVDLTGLVPYVDDLGNPCPWIFTNRGPFLFTQGQLVEFPLGEIQALSSSLTGTAWTLNNVYLYFNLGGMGELLQKYYARNLDNVGPERDEGLPLERRGTISALASYPGRVFVAIDGGYEGYSSILMLRDQGFHEIYRAPIAGERILALHYQPNPVSTTGRLWFTLGTEWCFLEFNPNPEHAYEIYKYTYEGYLITGWHDFGLIDVQKIFKSVSVFGYNFSPGERYIKLDYRLDNETAWTQVSGEFDESSKELDLAQIPPTAKRIQFRFRFYTNAYYLSPVMLSYVLKGYEIIPVKYSYSWTSLIANGALSVNLLRESVPVLGTFESVDQAVTKLKQWAQELTPLTLNSIYTSMNGKQVVLDAIPLQPVDRVDPPPDEIEERIIVHISVNET